MCPLRRGHCRRRTDGEERPTKPQSVPIRRGLCRRCRDDAVCPCHPSTEIRRRSLRRGPTFCHRHCIYTPRDIYTPTVTGSPPREVYAEVIRRRHTARRRGLEAVGILLDSCSGRSWHAHGRGQRLRCIPRLWQDEGTTLVAHSGVLLLWPAAARGRVWRTIVR
jgi:hypothetical protein